MASEQKIFQSPSGYAMPFEADENTGVNVISFYGKQTGSDGKEFFNHGIDFQVPQGTWLKALATGIVTGINSDPRNGFAITINYPNYGDGRKSAYDVVYSHITESLCNFGRNVKANDNVARCEGMLHLEVRFNGNEINPSSFITMLRDNFMVQQQLNQSGANPEIATLDFDVHTPYDGQQKEIDQLFARYFPNYLNAVLHDRYIVPKATEQVLRDAFSEGFDRHLFLENTPSLANPLGLGRRSYSLLERVQTLLVGDFLNYLALMERVFLSSFSETEKKKLLTGH